MRVLDRIRLLERKLDIVRELKLRFTREEAQLLRLIKQAKMREVKQSGSQS